MNFSKLIVLAILFETVFAGSPQLDLGDTYCDGTGWVAYKDEKCFKLIEKWSTRDLARDICAQELLSTDSSTPQLVSIKSADEQDYLTKFVFETSEVEVNVWIGAKRSSESPNKVFVWDDGSEVDYENWLEDRPTEDTNVGCVVMQSKYMRTLSSETTRIINGKWRDVTCKSANYVVCEKLPRWSLVKLQQTLLEQRRDLENTQNALSETKVKLEQTENRLSVSENKFEVLRKNPIPIGFIYVQLPHQPEPRTLWSTVQWKDVTSEYAGLFFRAEGGGSDTFGAIQEDNSPRVTEVKHSANVAASVGKWDSVVLSVGGWSSGIGVYSGIWSYQTHHTYTTHHFKTSGGEVRPRNAAMRIWKRVN